MTNQQQKDVASSSVYDNKLNITADNNEIHPERELRKEGNFGFLMKEDFKLSDKIFADSLTKKSNEELLHDLRKARNDLYRSNEKLLSVLEISSLLRDTTDYNLFLRRLFERISALMKAERSTLYLIDETGEYLVSLVILGEEGREIKLKLGQGIAGWVAQTGTPINLKNVYDDPRFNAKIDDETGFITHSMLCVPLRNHTGNVIGAVQVLNSRTGEFSEEDEGLLNAISCQASIAIENQRLYKSVSEVNEHLEDAKHRLEKRVLELNTLYDIEHHLAKTANLNSMLRVFTLKTAKALNAAAAAVALNVQGRVRLAITMQSFNRSDNPWSFQLKILKNYKEILPKDIEELFGTNYYLNRAKVEELRKQNRLSIEKGFPAKIKNMIGIPLQDDDGEIIGTIHAVNSIGRPDFSHNDIKLLYLIAGRVTGAIIVRRRADELAKSEQMAAIGGMLTGIVHDLKNPITVISGYIQLMARSNDPKVREKFKTQTLLQLHQLTDMTRELLIFAKGETSLARKLVNIRSHFNDLKDVLTQELASRNIELEINLEYDDNARLDPTKLNRVLLNLVRNSADAMDNGGKVTISVYLENSNLVVSVADTGKGIPKEVQDTLFDSFVTYGKEHGTGLGLAIVKSIVDQHNGTISFDTTPGKGTTFYVRIPLRTADTSNPPY